MQLGLPAVLRLHLRLHPRLHVTRQRSLRKICLAQTSFIITQGGSLVIDFIEAPRCVHRSRLGHLLSRQSQIGKPAKIYTENDTYNGCEIAPIVLVDGKVRSVVLE